jgi:hypothetical protein
MRAYAPALIAALLLAAAGAASAQDTTMQGTSMGHAKHAAKSGKGTGIIKKPSTPRPAGSPSSTAQSRPPRGLR